MRKINNPFTKIDGYNCFGCAPQNRIGLRMEFFEDGEDIVCFWQPSSEYQGYNDVLHGGIQATLMDEIASWVVFVKLQTSGVTAKMDIKLNKPVLCSAGKIELRARLVQLIRRIAVIRVVLFNEKREEAAEAEIRFFTYSKEQADEKFFKLDYQEFLK